jgi:hypothetical protein
MEPQPDQWRSKLPDGRIVTYTSNISRQGDGPLSAQVANERLKHTAPANGRMSRKEIEAIFAHLL